MLNQNEEDRKQRIEEHNKALMLLFETEKEDMINALNDDYQIEENQDDYLKMESNDPYDIQQIELGYEFNEWGVIRFYGIVKEFDRNNDEIVTSDSIGCLWDSYDPEFEDKESRREYKRQLKYAESDKPDIEANNWKDQPVKHVSLMGTDLTWYYEVEEFICFNNITHYHTIKGYCFKVESQRLEEVTGCLQLRDTFMRVGLFISKEAEI